MRPFGSVLLGIFLSLVSGSLHASELSPAAVGWGNLVVPGLGATLRGDSQLALTEAILEIGLFYGGTFGVREGSFTIDSTVLLPQRGNLYRPLIGQTLQQLGIKFHMYNTFYHYQQATLALAEKPSLDDLQPLYRGDWKDIVSAPFRWKHLSNPWVFGFLVPTIAYLFIDYKSNFPAPYSYRSTSTEDALYGMYNLAFEPMGSAYGEEPLFRGFVQRETARYTGSVPLAILLQSVLFTALHPAQAHLPAFMGGIYFGYLTHHFDGNIEQAVACHFWTNIFNGLFSYLNFLRSQGKSTPFSGPPLGITIGLPL